MGFLDKHKVEVDALFQLTKTYVNGKEGGGVDNFDSLKIKSRKKPLVIARKIMMVILMEVYNPEPHKYTQEEIAEIFNLDRTSLIYHTKMHMNDYGILKSYKEEYDKLKDEFLEQIGQS
jgi:hypothetical protein